eukprot:8783253-Ditylum_brightwellii.AAC.1
MAFLHIAGIAVLIWSYRPSKRADKVHSALECYADMRGEYGKNFKNNFVACGVVNAKNTLGLLEWVTFLAA